MSTEIEEQQVLTKKFNKDKETCLINPLTAGVRTTLAVEVAFKGPDENFQRLQPVNKRQLTISFTKSSSRI